MYTNMRRIVALMVVAVAVAAHDELVIENVHSVEGCERRSKDGDMLSMHYVGKLLTDMSIFDSSYDRKEPFVFQLGRRQVIPGWDQGLTDMCVGDKRLLRIPPHLAYGDTGAGGRIPPNSDLVFEVELIDIKDAPPHVNVFKEIDADDDDQLSREEVGTYLRKQIPGDMDQEDVASFDQRKMIEEIFNHEDKDKNGFISHEEFSGPKHDEL